MSKNTSDQNMAKNV